ncbi:MAG: uroporphyrinogen decarboxylase family protein [Clostridia bacterium]|nr:uroporphyrinogen decarboxylase family protein [Clostridia bacterium]
MNSKQRLDAYLKGERTDRRPNLTIIGSVVTQYTKITVEEYCKNPHAMADSAIACAKDCRLDFIQIASDLVRTAEALGSKINYFPEKLPSVASPALDDIEDVSKLKAPRVKDTKRLYDLVDATAYAASKCDDIYTMTLVTGPATIAGNTRGVQDFLVDALTEPEASEELMDIAVETEIDLIRELAAAGASYLYVADPVASLFSPEQYKTLILPRHQKIFGEMSKLGLGNRLHMCGDTTKIIPYSSTCGAQILDIDHAVSFEKALEAAQGRVVLNGNIDPVDDVYSASPEHTKAAIIKAADSIGRARAMFMPGCELPTLTNLENVKAISDALVEIGG